MILTREDIQRMTNSTGIGGIGRGGEGGGGGGGGVDLSGYATESWVDENYLSIAFFSKLFKAYNGQTEVIPNNASATVDSIKAMFGFWTQQYISALGQNSGGGSGGATALTDLVDVALTTPQTGQVLMYDSTSGKWVNGTVTPGGGGTVTSVGLSMPTGFSVIGSPVSSSGTIQVAMASGYAIPLAVDLEKGLEAYSMRHSHSNMSVLNDITSSKVSEWDACWNGTQVQNYAYISSGVIHIGDSSVDMSNYLTVTAFENLFNALDSNGTKVNAPYSSAVASIKAKFGLWTEQYLSALGLNSGGGSGAAALTDLVDVEIISPQTGQVLMYNGTSGKWYNGAGGGANSLADLVDVALTTPQTGQVLMYDAVSGKWYNGAGGGGGGGGTVTSITAGTGLSGGTITTSGTIAINSTYQGYIQQGVTAYGWGNHATAGYATPSSVATQMSNYAYISNGTVYLGNSSITPVTSVSGTLWGQTFTNGGTVTGSINNAGAIFMNSHLYMNAQSSTSGGKGLMAVGYESSGSLEYASFGFHAANSAQWATDALSMQLVMDSASGAVASKYVRIYGGLRIGHGMLLWDDTNGAFKVIKDDGTAAHLYTTGGVSALGMSAGVSAVDAMTFGYLTVNNTLTMGNASISHDADDNLLFNCVESIYINRYTFIGDDGSLSTSSFSATDMVIGSSVLTVSNTLRGVTIGGQGAYNAMLYIWNGTQRYRLNLAAAISAGILVEA